MRSCTRLIILLTLFASLCAGPVDAAEQDRHEPPKGFDALFNGKDLEGWFGGETRDAGFSKGWGEPQWSGYRNQMHKAVAKHWRIQNNELIGTGAGPDIVTWERYNDFELYLEWKVSPNSEAGVSLRGYPGIRLWDTSSEALRKLGSNKGSGRLVQNEKDAKPPAQSADKPTGQWNQMLVRMVGPYVTVILNGKKVLNKAAIENAFKPGTPVDAAGPIHLRTRNGEVRFRNIAIHALSDEESNKVLAEAAGDKKDYAPLFNGKDFTGWTGATGSYEIIDNGVRCKRGGHGLMVTEKPYSDFIVRFEFKVPPGGNNGLAIRAPSPRNVGLEIQVLDNPHEMFQKLKADQYHGSAYGIAPARRGYLRPTGQWNYQEVHVKADHIRVVLNGYEILNIKLKQAAPKHPAASRTQGHFGFVSHSDPVAFRSVRIKELQ